MEMTLRIKTIPSWLRMKRRRMMARRPPPLQQAMQHLQATPQLEETPQAIQLVILRTQATLTSQ
jgi:hypothetical protein